MASEARGNQPCFSNSRIAVPPVHPAPGAVAAAVADLRSFRRAAELCRVSQPALSSQLAALGEGLGTRLFERDRRRVIPTPS